MRVHRINPDITVLSDHHEVPTIGYIPVNAFVLHAREPVIVDTGLGLADRDFVATLAGVMDPADVRWIWLTHPDRDHTGGIFPLLEAAPQAQLVTTFVGAGLLSLERPPPLHRMHLVNPGGTLDVGDRLLHAFRPPLFDNPTTVGLFDPETRTCFSSDCFGAPMPTADLASCADVRAVPAAELRAMQLLWATVDSPWVHTVRAGDYLNTVRAVQAMAPDLVLSTHLPPAAGITAQLLDMLAAAPAADPFVGPDQRALEQILAGFEPATP
jgi:hypothetical protein